MKYELAYEPHRIPRISIPVDFPLRGKRKKVIAYDINRNGKKYVEYFIDSVVTGKKWIFKTGMPVRVFCFPLADNFVFEALKSKRIDDFFYVIYDAQMRCVGMIERPLGMRDPMASIYVDKELGKTYLEVAMIISMVTVLDYTITSDRDFVGVGRRGYSFLKEHGQMMFDMDFYAKNNWI